MNDIFRNAQKLCIKIRYRTLFPPQKLDYKITTLYGIKLKIDNELNLFSVWDSFDSPINSSDDADPIFIHYKKELNIIIEPDISVDDMFRIEQDFFKLYNRIKKNNPTTNVTYKRKDPFVFEEKIYAVDFELQFDILEIVNNDMRGVRLGVVCFTNIQGGFIAYDEFGMFYTFKSERRNVHIGDCLVFRLEHKSDDNIITLRSKYLFFDKFIDNGFGQNFIPAENYFQKYCYNYHITSRYLELYNEYAASYKEDFLIRNYINRDKFIPSKCDEFFTLYKQIDEYLNNLDIRTIFNSYKYSCGSAGVSHHPGEFVYYYDETIDTDDQYIKKYVRDLSNKLVDKLFPPPSKEPFKWHSNERDKFLIEKAKEMYKKEQHLLFLLKKEMDEIYNIQNVRNKCLEYWPTSHYADILEKIPRKNLLKFLNLHNQEILPYGIKIKLNQIEFN